MSSRAWTEVTTGAEARSVRRWALRAVFPALTQSALVLALLLIGLLAYWELFWAVSPDPPESYPPWVDETLFEPGIRPSHVIGDVIKDIIGEDGY